MTVRINPQYIRLSLACIQPASASDVAAFTKISFKDEARNRLQIEAEAIRHLFETWETEGDIACVYKKGQLYSLTKQGDEKLTGAERKLRDRTRLFLLKELRSSARLVRPDAGGSEKADVSSAEFIDPSTQEDERPIVTVATPRQARSTARAYWPLLSKQLFVGSSSPASGPNLRYLSFPSEAFCIKASGSDLRPNGFNSSLLALAIGVSPRLISAMLHKPERHYRTFEIPKSNGKNRTITAPRTMMKVVQYFILDYFLTMLPVHNRSTAFGPGCSIKANAEPHVRKKYVANIDVENFFPSIAVNLVTNRLLASGVKIDTAILISRICAYGGGLPQGAPTSPALSNIVLYEFDRFMSDYCDGNDIAYTRYADDITLSGNQRESIVEAIKQAENQLNHLGLNLNKEKTRIFGPASRQVVTGLVVNDWPQPSRKDRRKLRAILHQASLFDSTTTGLPSSLGSNTRWQDT